MNCGRSSSVEWKLPKLQRRVRFPSPAPPPPGYAPGGFVMPPRQARLASHALFYLPLAPSRSLVGAHPVQNSPSSQPSGRHRYKTPPAPPKWPISARFTPAGRTLYRLRHQQTEQGEKSPAPTPHLTHQRAPPTIPHAIRLRELSTKPRNVAIPTSSVPHSGVTVWWSARLIWVRSPCDPSRKLSTSDSK